jgi:hypothetical protein
METETIELSKQLMESVRQIIEETKLFRDEEDFITQSIVKQISKFK